MSALLNVSVDVVDSMFMDTFDVVRRVEIVDAHGRSTLVPTTYPQIRGTVVPISPNNLDRHDGYQNNARSIKVVTRFRLQGEVTGNQPDVVVWRGDRFVVKAIDYFHSFGGGHVETECVSMDKTDAAITLPNPGALLYNRAEDNVLPLILGN